MKFAQSCAIPTGRGEGQVLCTYQVTIYSMKTTLYSVTVPLFKKHLKNLSPILEKAEAHLGTQELLRLMNDGLAEDMFPLGRQIEITCDTAKGAASRLSGKDMPRFDDGDYSLETLTTRIKETIAYLDTIGEADFAESETQRVVLPFIPDRSMDGFGYATEYALPNFFFHMTTAYGILRKNGVPLGKTDYIGGLPFSDESA